MDSKHVIFFMYVLIYIVVILELLFGDSKSGSFFFSFIHCMFKGTQKCEKSRDCLKDLLKGCV